MNYLEKVINDRIEELKINSEQTINTLKEKLNNNKLECVFDIQDCFLEVDINDTRIDELEKLKKGLGLVPVEEKKNGLIDAVNEIKRG